jgi:hypothetical protein
MDRQPVQVWITHEECLKEFDCGVQQTFMLPFYCVFRVPWRPGLPAPTRSNPELIFGLNILAYISVHALGVGLHRSHSLSALRDSKPCYFDQHIACSVHCMWHSSRVLELWRVLNFERCTLRTLNKWESSFDLASTNAMPRDAPYKSWISGVHSHLSITLMNPSKAPMG